MIQIISDYGGMLLKAMGQTLLLTLLGLLFACILGLLFGILSVMRSKVCNVIAAIFVNVVRGVPLIVLAYFIYFGIPYGFNNILNMKFTLTALQAGTAALALNCGAYMAEIIRGGIQAVDPGQMEAARSLGLPYWRALQRVVLPQAIKIMIPSIINQFIITLKDSSILSVIGFPELVNTAKNVVAISFKSLQTWAVVAIMYLIVILILSRISKWLEKRLSYDGKLIMGRGKVHRRRKLKNA
ncbi:MAG: amino acid ABC transporter permease [Eubacterium sp.]|nr:amino acid ABC transporter permease [Eubacterium sp.]